MSPMARVVRVDERPTSRWRPKPLATVEMQRRAARWLRMGSARSLEVAEALYNKGFISYPRTETEVFKEGTNLDELIAHQQAHPTWGGFATSLANGGFQWPSRGGGDDNAHPPIHPLRLATGGDLANADEVKLYELVTRHFLACCSKDAVGSRTSVHIAIAGEEFTASGLMIKEKNYLEVYKYDRWTEQSLPVYGVGQTFAPSTVELPEGRTVAPPLLSESDLIKLMDDANIGTDATIATHIKTIQDRSYAILNSGNKFEPTPLGLALVQGLNAIERGLAEPALRAWMERDCVAICESRKTRAQVVRQVCDEMRSLFSKLVRERSKLATQMGAQFRPPVFDSDMLSPRLARCGTCNNPMDLLLRKQNGRTVGNVMSCERCDQVHRVPKSSDIRATDHICPLCRSQVLSVERAAGGATYNVCPHCYSTPPASIVADIEEGPPSDSLPCFNCPADCELAGSSPPLYRCPSCRVQSVYLGRTQRATRFLSCRGCGWKRYAAGALISARVTRDPPTFCVRCRSNGRKSRQVIIRIPPHMPTKFRSNEPWCLHPDCNLELDYVFAEARTGGGRRQPNSVAPSSRGSTYHSAPGAGRATAAQGRAAGPSAQRSAGSASRSEPGRASGAVASFSTFSAGARAQPQVLQHATAGVACSSHHLTPELLVQASKRSSRTTPAPTTIREFADLQRRNELHKATVKSMRSFLKSQGKPSSGKKEHLIQLVRGIVTSSTNSRRGSW